MSDMNVLRFYLIRHGEVEPDAKGKLIGGNTNVALSERGIEQAHRLGKKLESVPLDAIYSSDLQRAYQTANAIAEYNQVKVQPSAVWREINMGLWEGRSLSSLNEEAPEQVSSLFSDPSSFKYPKGESFTAFKKRINDALNHLLSIHTSGEIALIAHGGVCRVIIGCILDVPMQNWLRVSQHYGCLNIIEWYERQPVIVSLNVLEATSIEG